MGKKSLIKSTTKKKSSANGGEEKAAKKTVKKTTKKAAPKSTTKTAKKAAPKKASPKKSAAKKATAKKNKAAPKKTAKKAAPKKVSIKQLVFKKFEAPQAVPEPMAAPNPATTNVSAPPLIASQDPKEVKRLQALLFSKFDMDDIKAAAKEPKPLPEPKIEKKAAPEKAKPAKKVSIKELVFKKFEPLQAAPAQMAAPKLVVSNISAPPLIGTTDPKEVERLRALLFNKFNMDDIKAAAKEPEPLPEPKIEKKAAPEKAKPAKKVSIKELVFKKFGPLQAAPAQMTAPKPVVSNISAPPLIGTTDPKEVERLRALLFNKFNMDDIKAAAKEPKPLPEPKIENAPSPAAAPAEDNAYITVEPTESNGGTETLSLPVKITIAVAATVVFLMLAISYNNGSKYYIQPKEGAIEIWKGRFSPKDTKLFMTLDGAAMPETVKEIYTKAEIFPLILDYYIDKADTLLEGPGLPDFQGIKDYLLKAEDFIVTTEAKTAVTSRLNNIERMILLYKADVAISRNTEDSLESAIRLLKKAAKLTASTAMSEEIAQKIDGAREQIVALEAEAQQQAEELKAARETEKMEAEQEKLAEELKAAPEKDPEEPAAPEKEAH